jgi:hypothetical protein
VSPWQNLFVPFALDAVKLHSASTTEATAIAPGRTQSHIETLDMLTTSNSPMKLKTNLISLVIGTAIGASALLSVAAVTSTDTEFCGRFQFIVTADYLYKIDTTTGQVWRTWTSQPSNEFMAANIKKTNAPAHNTGKTNDPAPNLEKNSDK